MDESQDLRVLESHVDPGDLEVSAGSDASLDHGNLLEMVVVKAPSDNWSSAVAFARAEAVKIVTYDLMVNVFFHDRKSSVVIYRCT